MQGDWAPASACGPLPRTNRTLFIAGCPVSSPCASQLFSVACVAVVLSVSIDATTLARSKEKQSQEQQRNLVRGFPDRKSVLGRGSLGRGQGFFQLLEHFLGIATFLGRGGLAIA